MDLFWQRTSCKMELARNLMNLADEQIDAWCITENGDVKLCDDAYILNRLQIRQLFGYLLRIGLNKFVKNGAVVQCSDTPFRIKN